MHNETEGERLDYLATELGSYRFNFDEDMRLHLAEAVDERDAAVERLSKVAVRAGDYVRAARRGTAWRTVNTFTVDLPTLMRKVYPDKPGRVVLVTPTQSGFWGWGEEGYTHLEAWL